MSAPETTRWVDRAARHSTRPSWPTNTNPTIKNGSPSSGVCESSQSRSTKSCRAGQDKQAAEEHLGDQDDASDRRELTTGNGDGPAIEIDLDVERAARRISHTPDRIIRIRSDSIRDVFAHPSSLVSMEVHLQPHNSTRCGTILSRIFINRICSDSDQIRITIQVDRCVEKES